TSKVTLAFVTATFPIVINTVVGMAQTPPEMIHLMRSLGASGLQTFTKVRLIAAAPHVFGGFKIGITLAMVGAVVGEFIASNSGLGYFLLIANNAFDAPLLFGIVILLSLLMVTAGLYHPRAGQVVIDGRPVIGPWDGVGMVFQRDLLLEWRTVLENVLLPVEVKRLPRSEFEGRARSLLRLVGLAGFEGAYPEQLSIGMRQRVGICRALVHDAVLLLMDERFDSVVLLPLAKLGLVGLRFTDETL